MNMRMSIPPPVRSAIEYTAATVVPVAIGFLMPGEPPAVSPFFLWMAIVARFFGFGPALACTFSSVASLWLSATAVRLDGTFVQVERAGIPLIHGDKVYAQGFVRDVTERLASEARVESLSARLLRAQEAEQRRLAKQLHDTTAQDLVAIRLNLASIRRSPAITDPRLKEVLTESMELTEQVISEIRTLSYLLHPPLIEEAGLAGALKWYTAGFEARSGVKVDVKVPEDLHIAH